MMKNYIFAHAGEGHSNVAESTEHVLNASGGLVILLAMTVLILIPVVLKSKMPRSNVPTIVLLGELFLVGILTYSALPVLSILALSIGFMLAFIFVIAGLSSKG